MDYGDLVLRTFPDGTRLTLADIADINDGFVENEGFGHFDGEPTATLRVLATGQQNELHTADVVREYVEGNPRACRKVSRSTSGSIVRTTCAAAWR